MLQALLREEYKQCNSLSLSFSLSLSLSLSLSVSLSLSIPGVGFVGRHLTTYLVSNKLASKIRVADKVPPATGWLNTEHAVSDIDVNVCVWFDFSGA